MKTITLTLYGSHLKLTPGHVRVRQQPAYYVRAVQTLKGIDLALAMTRPLRSEIVLNTVEIEVP